MAPKSNKPPPPSRADRKKIDTGAKSNVSSARESILSKGIGLPGASNPSPFGGLKKPGAAPISNAAKPPPPSRAARQSLAPSPRAATPSKPAPVARPSVTPRGRAPPPPAPTQAPAEDEKPMARAAYDYAGTGAGSELLFKTGQEIIILQKDDSGWWEGELDGVTGWFPAEFVKEIEIVRIRRRFSNCF